VSDDLPPLPQGYAPHELPADYTGRVWIEGQVRAVQRAALAQQPAPPEDMKIYDRIADNYFASVAQPQAEPVAYLYQHGETGRTRIVMPDQCFTNSQGQWLYVGPLHLGPTELGSAP